MRSQESTGIHLVPITFDATAGPFAALSLSARAPLGKTLLGEGGRERGGGRLSLAPPVEKMGPDEADQDATPPRPAPGHC